MFSAETCTLRESILTEARCRGVPLAEERTHFEHGLAVMRVRLGERVLLGVCVRFPGSSRQLPDVITVHGSGHRRSRMWPRKRDGSFRIDAIVDYMLTLVREELERPQPDLALIAKDVPAAASGLYVMHLGAVLLGTMTRNSRAETLVAEVRDERRRTMIGAHMQRGGLLDSDLRALGDAAGVFFSRATKLDDMDPFEPISDRILTMLKLGRHWCGRVELRTVLLLSRRADEISIADPAGEGVVRRNIKTIEKAWKLGRAKGRPWLGTIFQMAATAMDNR